MFALVYLVNLKLNLKEYINDIDTEGSGKKNKKVLVRIWYSVSAQ